MAAFAGRSVAFEWNNAAVLGVREKGITLNGEPINVSSDEDSGKRILLSVAAEDSVDISLSGVTKDTRLKTDWFAGTRTRAVEITYPNGDTITGNFMLASYSEADPYNDAQTFEATLQSSDGTFLFTPYS